MKEGQFAEGEVIEGRGGGSIEKQCVTSRVE